jgi:Holliday junction resolvase RusA-like endonuclease
MGNVAVVAQRPLWQGTILGNPESKANSRRQVLRRSKRTGKSYVASIKSAKAESYSTAAVLQLKPLRPREPIAEDVSLTCHIWYADRRHDLDESIICDALQQAGIIENDRAIRQKHIFGYVDKHRPRAVIVLERVEA